MNDDNESFHSAPTTEMLCKSTLDDIILTGYISLITKLAREVRGEKSDRVLEYRSKRRRIYKKL
jgi:hypothetical protein